MENLSKTKNSNEIDDLISNFDELKKCGHILNISNEKQLISGLIELNKMVEMESAKSTVVSQIKCFLINPNSTNMNHAVISGDPGVGKTTLGKILAKIWVSLGIIKHKKFDIDDLSDSKIIMSQRIKISELTLGIEKNFLMTESLNLKSKMLRQTSGIRSFYEFKNGFKDIDNNVLDINKSITKLYKKSIDFLPITMEPKFVVATRSDFIAKYLGQTAHRTKTFLDKNRGSVIFIDEAYSLVNSERSSDSYGHEALTVINEYMSNYPEDYIFIFGGYKDKLEETIFRVQPGLRRRCTWIFDIPEYTSSGLSQILEKQLLEKGVVLEKSIDVESALKINSDLFDDGGGSTEKLTSQCMLAYNKVRYDILLSDPKNFKTELVKTLTNEMFDIALDKHKLNIFGLVSKSSKPLTYFM